MFDQIKTFINDYLSNCETKVNIESETIYGNAKIEYAVSTEDFGASISILSDLTYDFFATDIENEEMLMTKTMNFRSIDELFKQLEEDLDNFSKLKK